MGKKLNDWRTQKIDGKSLSQWREDEWTEEMYGPLDSYDRKALEFSLENDEISDWEAGFMEGYDGAS
ncbi:MAG: hypothetical protein AABX47_08935 [Nanoarchaeota archaeon]